MEREVPLKRCREEIEDREIIRQGIRRKTETRISDGTALGIVPGESSSSSSRPNVSPENRQDTPIVPDTPN